MANRIWYKLKSKPHTLLGHDFTSLAFSDKDVEINVAGEAANRVVVLPYDEIDGLVNVEVSATSRVMWILKQSTNKATATDFESLVVKDGYIWIETEGTEKRSIKCEDISRARVWPKE